MLTVCYILSKRSALCDTYCSSWVFIRLLLLSTRITLSGNVTTPRIISLSHNNKPEFNTYKKYGRYQFLGLVTVVMK